MIENKPLENIERKIISAKIGSMIFLIIMVASILLSFYFYSKLSDKNEELELVKNQLEENEKLIRKQTKNAKDLAEKYRDLAYSRETVVLDIAELITKHIETIRALQVAQETIIRMEEARRIEQSGVTTLYKPEDLLNRLRSTYPEFAHSNWGVTEIYNEEEDIGIEYLLVPVWFAETFIIEHQNSEAYRMQRDKLLMMDSLQIKIIFLVDRVLVLEKQISSAYKTGYDNAYTKYEEVNKAYIKLLEKTAK